MKEVLHITLSNGSTYLIRFVYTNVIGPFSIIRFDNS